MGPFKFYIGFTSEGVRASKCCIGDVKICSLSWTDGIMEPLQGYGPREDCPPKKSFDFTLLSRFGSVFYF